jgi:hypothetical protein
MFSRFQDIKMEGEQAVNDLFFRLGAIIINVESIGQGKAPCSKLKLKFNQSRPYPSLRTNPARPS